jgi:hypothetical protein
MPDLPVFANGLYSNEYGFAMTRVHYLPKNLPMVRFGSVRISCRFTIIAGQSNYV